MTQILASGNTEAPSSTFTLTAGQAAPRSLFDASGPVLPDDATAHIQYQASNSQWMNFVGGELTARNPSLVLEAIGTFRVLRMRCSGDFGVDRD